MAKRKKSNAPRKRPRRTARLDRVSARAVEAALAGIAHDIRTPLTGIVALAELLASSNLGQREREWANAVKSGAEHLAALASLIVDAAKADATDLVLRREPFSPQRLIDAVGRALAARAGNKGIDVKIATTGALPGIVLGDMLRLRAALENLADNAVKFTDQGGVALTAAAERAGRRTIRLIFTVADSGIGIEPAALKRLFRPFAQASGEIARRYGGAGLGLAYVKRIAKAMGGDLAVTSKKGRGTTFRLTALVERADQRPLAEQRLRTALTRPLAILCAEDNPYGRVVMNTILTELGHRVDFAETGAAAIEAAARGGYDAMLMDVTLPDIDGLEVTRRVRALPGKAGKVPVIGISGHSESGNEAQARAAGMNSYFVKPVSPAKLAETLAAITK